MSQAIIKSIEAAIVATIPNASAQVAGSGGHYEIEVVSEQFQGKGILERHRLVYAAITPLMTGNEAPVHAIDRLDTRTP